MGSTALTIGGLAAAAGVNVETIRFYQRRGLLAQPLRPHGGVRRYTAADVDRLRFIRRAKLVGFTLEEIADLLEANGRGACARTSRQIERKLAEVRERMAALRAVEADLLLMAAACSSAGDSEYCPSLDMLGEAE